LLKRFTGGFLQDIQSLKPESHLNWQSMARKYQIQTKNGVFPLNGGKVFKEFAKQNGINTNHFNNHVRVRRTKKRLTSKVAIPSYRSWKHIKAIVKEKSENWGLQHWKKNNSNNNHY
jgi:hypothetical protein